MSYEMEKNPDPLDYKARMSELGMTEKGQSQSRLSENSPLVTRDSSGKMDVSELFVKIIQPCLAELFGVAFFVFIGLCSLPSGDLITEGVAFGLALAITIASIGSISGGHFNPAVTVGVAISGGIGPIMSLFYILAQLIGAILGAACCRGVLNYTYTPEDSTAINTESETVYEHINGGATLLNEHVGVGTAVLAEIIATSLLVLVVLMTAVNSQSKSKQAPFFIGLALLVGILAVDHATDGSLNPARSFGPCVVYSSIDTDVWDDHWVYWVGPLCGGILAGGLYRLLFADEEKRLLLKQD